MNAAALREACLAMTGAEETFPFGPENSVFKVEGKIFALSRLGGEPPLRISLKCDPGLAEQLRASHPAILTRLSPQQAPLEHRRPRRLGPRRDGARHDRGQLRPHRGPAAEAQAAGAGWTGA
jgi:hypothetical protein